MCVSSFHVQTLSYPSFWESKVGTKHLLHAFAAFKMNSPSKCLALAYTITAAESHDTLFLSLAN